MKSLALSNERAAAYKASGVILSNDVSPGSLPHGGVCLANDSLLRQSEYIEELTSFAISYDGMVINRLVQLRDFLAPPRSSSSRIVRLTTFDENEPFQTVDYNKVKRGILGDFAMVEQRIASKSDLQIPNRGLSVKLDRDQLKDKPDWQHIHTKFLIDLMNRATVQEAVVLLEASATQVSTTWDSASNPDLEIKQDVINTANSTGFYLRNAIYGDLAALKRQTAYENQLTAGSLARAGQFSEDQMAVAIGLDKVMVNAERYIGNTASTIKTEFIGSNVILFTAMAESPMDASNMVRHVANASYGGGDYAVYVTEVGPKIIVLTVENYEYLHIQHTTGLMQIAVN